jgi:hypothetical protein
MRKILWEIFKTLLIQNCKENHNISLDRRPTFFEFDFEFQKLLEFENAKNRLPIFSNDSRLYQWWFPAINYSMREASNLYYKRNGATRILPATISIGSEAKIYSPKKRDGKNSRLQTATPKSCIAYLTRQVASMGDNKYCWSIISLGKFSVFSENSAFSTYLKLYLKPRSRITLS